MKKARNDHKHEEERRRMQRKKEHANKNMKYERRCDKNNKN